MSKTSELNMETLKRMSNAIRVLAAEGVQKANSGHPGMPMGIADVATILFSKYLNIDVHKPDWPDRDRFVLSAGHGSMLIYALNYLLGYSDMNIESLKNFRQLHSNTPGHPEYGDTLGVETTTGPLGQGLGTAVGMALAERMSNAKFGKNLVDHFTYVMVGDGCLQEGISHESIEFAGHLKLAKLIVLWDNNSISIDGNTNLSNSSNQIARFKASGWHTQSVDGHDFDQISKAIENAQKTNKPSFIACKTIIGFGSPNLAGTEKTHGAPLGDDEVKKVKEELNWKSNPFEVPKDILSNWRASVERGLKIRKEWEDRFNKSPKKNKFIKNNSNNLSQVFDKNLKSHIQKLKLEKPKLATRQASLEFLKVLSSNVDNIAGGSADLTGSNLTKTPDMNSVKPKKFKANYIHYGIREHMMGAVMNGIALHKGFITYGGTFLVFSDYMRSSIRLSALMKTKVIYVLTHDSIGLGEDGPTHQPVEHLAMLRATPNLNVFRPADAVETAEAWELALKYDGPSILALSRQGLKTFRDEKGNDNLTSKGGYLVKDFGNERDLTIIATGSEVEIALETSDLLLKDNIKASVVSLPCWEIFEKQSEEYKLNVLGEKLKVGVEAGSELGWHKYIGSNGIFIGMKTFGASAPANHLFEHFGLSSDKIREKILGKINT